MKYVYIIVEGPSEERFVKGILAPYFERKNIYLTAECVITGQDSQGKLCKGGGNSYALYKNHLEKRLKQFSTSPNYFFTTMIDFYALPKGFPNSEKASAYSDKYQHIEFLEENFKNDIGALNFIPYIQLHEFESLLLHNIQKIADEFFDVSVNVKKFQEEIAKYDNLELVNSSKENAPSKRIDKYTDGQYCGSKVTSSFNILQNIDVDVLRCEYRHFDEWLTKIENIS